MVGRVGRSRASPLSTSLTSAFSCPVVMSSSRPCTLNGFPVTLPPTSTPHQHDLYAYDQDSNGPHEHVSHASKRPIAHLLGGPLSTSLLKFPATLLPRRFASKFTVTDSRDAIYGSPNFTHIERPSPSAESNRAFSYFMVGATGVLGALGAKSTVLNFLTSWSASHAQLAMAQVEVDLSAIPEGKSVVIKWRGKPIFIRHRTAPEVEEAQAVNIAELRDPQTDADRTQKPEWIVMLGICTHLGCVPLANSGDYNGWYCPCQ